MIVLFLGGEKSGKSDAALRLADSMDGRRAFVATGQALDDDFAARIKAHRDSREGSFVIYEARKELADVLRFCAAEYQVTVVDSLDFWVFSMLSEQAPEAIDPAEVLKLEEVLSEFCGPDRLLVLVSCEVGLGPVAASRETRHFVRAQGFVNRHLAALADEVFLIVAGLPLTLKGGPPA